MDHYQRLGVPRRASAEALRAAYRAAARDLHPDRGGGDPERMALLNEAWSVLGDADRRADYDATLDLPAPRPGRHQHEAPPAERPATEHAMTGYVIRSPKEAQLRRLMRVVFVSTVVFLAVMFMYAFAQSGR